MLGAVGLLSVAVAGLNLLIVWALARIVDGVVAEGAGAFVAANVAPLALFAALLAVVNPLVAFLKETLLSQSAQTLLPAAIRWQAYKAVEGQDVAFFEDAFAGQVASRISQVTQSVQRQMMLAIDAVPRFLIQFVGSATLLAVLAWPLAIPVLCWLAGNALLAWKAVPVYIERSRRVAAANSRAVGAMTDIYSNIKTVKLFAAEDSETGAVRGVLRDTIDTQHRANRYHIVSNTLVIAFNSLLLIAAFAVGLWGMAAERVSVGDFVAALTIVRQLSTSAFAFIGLGQQIANAVGTIDDAMPIMTRRPRITDREDAAPLAVTEGRIDFDDVRFAYPQGVAENGGAGPAPPVIEGLSLSVAPGERLGIVGLSGAGKSTLLGLLLRLREPDGGAIRIDGQDVRGVTQASLRAQIAVVTQDVALFNRSVRDNLRYGASGADDAEIERAVALAEAGDFVASLRDGDGREGLDAHVGDRGVKLSGGQRQRLTIARAILKDAPILLLDEATSALDSQAEAAIQRNLAGLMRGRTTLAVAHRLSTIAAMDRLVVMDGGRIVESGRHEELLELDGLYARLWERQSGGFIATSTEGGNGPTENAPPRD